MIHRMRVLQRGGGNASGNGGEKIYGFGDSGADTQTALWVTERIFVCVGDGRIDRFCGRTSFNRPILRKGRFRFDRGGTAMKEPPAALQRFRRKFRRKKFWISEIYF